VLLIWPADLELDSNPLSSLTRVNVKRTKDASSMTPWWVALVAALAGGLLATVVRTRYDRNAETRKEMTEAARAFSRTMQGHSDR
jgi:hypothetical protein